MADRLGDEEHGRWSGAVAFGALALVLWGQMARPAWQARAACRDHEHPRWWAGGRRYAEHARAVCHDCPVWRECLADVTAWEGKTATRAVNTVGVAGGMTATERYALYRAMPGAVGSASEGQRRRPRR